MIKILRKLIDFAQRTVEGKRFLAPAKPILQAADSFFFGPGELTTGPPHIRDTIDIKRYMIMVLLALIPCIGFAISAFGIRVFYLIMISYIFGGICEVLFAIIRKHEINEGFLITGIIYPLILPPDLPYWMAAVGIVVGVVFGKEVFGGTGKNIFNPAMVGRLFIAIAFPVHMTTRWQIPFVDAVTQATPLMSFKSSGELVSLGQLFIGNIPGSVGEVCKLAIILGGVFLMLTRVANWRIPLAYLGSVALLSVLFNKIWPELFAPPLFQLFSGGLLFAAMFMATDPVTSPFTQAGRWLYGILLGVLTLCIRGFSGYVEGVMFAIVFMNIFAPLLDQLILTLRYKNVQKNLT